MITKVFTWGWKEQPPMADIAAAVNGMSAVGQVFLCEADTKSDQYAWVLSDVKLTPAQATLLSREA